MDKIYVAIDLKSFYASVECLERGLDPLTTNLVVADKGKTEKTICLAVTPSLKKYGISGRARLFEVVTQVNKENYNRQKLNWNKPFNKKTYDDKILQNHRDYAVDFIIAPPRMAYYMEYSTRVYNVYLKYFAPEDIHVYSIDEVFIDITNYINTYKLTPRELVVKIVSDVMKTTGITATAGIGTNLYLAKIAMDIVAKKIIQDENGVRIAQLDEFSYREQLWSHKPITDFWRVGKGYSKRLNDLGISTMGDVAKCSIGKPNEFYNEKLLYKIFGINAELLIDHAWGYEPCTIADIKSYKPNNKSIGTGQVLLHPYGFEQAKLVVCEMCDLLSLDLVDKGFMTNQIVLTIGYDIDNMTNPDIRNSYFGEVVTDAHGRKIPKHSHGTVNLPTYTSSTKLIVQNVETLFSNIVNEKLLIRRINISANKILSEKDVPKTSDYEQINLFTDYEKLDKENEKKQVELKKERKTQEALIQIKKKYGKNAVFKGMNLKKGATAIERNQTIGGHKA